MVSYPLGAFLFFSHQMGGLQKASRWEGPMLTDSGGYQIFSMGHGSVGDEIKGRRGAEGTAEFGESLRLCDAYVVWVVAPPPPPP